MTTSREKRIRARSRDVVASATGAAVYSLSLGIASVALPCWPCGAAYSATEIGALTALSAVSQLVTRMFLGPAMRRWPDWTLIAGGTLLLAVSSGIAPCPRLVPFLLAQLLQGVSRACFWTGSQTHVVRGSGRAAGALATMNFVAGIGLLAGPVVVTSCRSSRPRWPSLSPCIPLLGKVPPSCWTGSHPSPHPADRPAGADLASPGRGLGCWAGMTAGGVARAALVLCPGGPGHRPAVGVDHGALVALGELRFPRRAALAARVPPRWSARTVLGGIVVTGVATALTAALAWNAGLSAVVHGQRGRRRGHPGPGPGHRRGVRTRRSAATRSRSPARSARAALFAAPLAVAGLVAVLPLAPAVALVGAAIAVGDRAPAPHPPTGVLVRPSLRSTSTRTFA